jgi:hypothetical protein
LALNLTPPRRPIPGVKNGSPIHAAKPIRTKAAPITAASVSTPGYIAQAPLIAMQKREIDCCDERD